MVITLGFFLWHGGIWDLKQNPVFAGVMDINPYVQLVGWCQENGRTLVAPGGEWTGSVFFEVIPV